MGPETLTKQEIEVLCNMIDIAVKQLGVRVAADALHLVNKLTRMVPPETTEQTAPETTV